MPFIAFVSHDESLTGAPMILSAVADYFFSDLRWDGVVISKAKGSAHTRFARRFSVWYPDDEAAFRELPVYEKALEFLRKFSPDLVYVNSIDCSDYVLAARHLGIPALWHLHELPSEFDRWEFDHRLMPGEAEEALASADRLIVPADEVRDCLISRYGVRASKITIIPEFVDIASLREAVSQASSTAAVPWTEVIGCGNASIRKGFDIFLQVAARLSDYRFSWVGELHKFHLNFQVPDNVRLIGEVQNAHAYLSRAEVFLLTSREDPFPVVALEAMALGKPVIAWRYGGGIHRAIGTGGVALEDPGPDAFAGAIRHLLVDADARIRAGRAGQKRVERYYSDSRCLPRIRHAVETLLGP